MICTWTTPWCWPRATAATPGKHISYIIPYKLDNSIPNLKLICSDQDWKWYVTYPSIAFELALLFLCCLMFPILLVPLLLLPLGCWPCGYLDGWFEETNCPTWFCEEIGGAFPTGEGNPEDEDAIFTAIAIVIDCCTALIRSYSWWQNNLWRILLI